MQPLALHGPGMMTYLLRVLQWIVVPFTGNDRPAWLPTVLRWQPLYDMLKGSRSGILEEEIPKEALHK